MKCITCHNLQLRDHPKHANVGFGQCKAKLESGAFVSFEFDRNCSTYKRADEDVILKRMEWQESKK